MYKYLISSRLVCMITALFLFASPGKTAENLWQLAQENADTLRFSTLFTAQDMRNLLSKPEGVEQALQWCRDTAVTQVYMESFRDGYTAEKETLKYAKKKFEEAGMLVSGCITTTDLGRKSVNGWRFPCFTDPQSLEMLEQSFRYAAELFDEIMIDDFYATSCECEDCVKAKGEKSWADFRCDLLVEVARKHIIEPAREVNPRVQLIIKYPQWYDSFHDNGYEIVRETEMFDTIWVGTETRDPDNQEWGGKAQYEAYFIMRWLSKVGGEKTGGGWFDPYGTTEHTYLEQARQTVLAGAKEAMLFCYGSLLEGTGPENIKALRKEIPQLFELAELIKNKPIRGIHAPKPPNSPADGDQYIYDFIGMLGLPLVPDDEVRSDVQAAFLSYHSLKDDKLEEKLKTLAEKKIPILATSNLKNNLPEDLQASLNEALVLEVPADKWDLMNLREGQLHAIQEAMLQPFQITFKAPSRIALYLYEDDLTVIENFNDTEVTVQYKNNASGNSGVSVTSQGSVSMRMVDQLAHITISPRSMVIIKHN